MVKSGGVLLMEAPQVVEPDGDRYDWFVEESVVICPRLYAAQIEYALELNSDK